MSRYGAGMQRRGCGDALGGASLSVVAMMLLLAVPSMAPADPGIPPQILSILSQDQTIDPGESRTYDVSVSGVDDPAAVTFSGDGVTATVLSNRRSRLRLSVTAELSAPAGLRNLTIVNPDGLFDTYADAILVTGDEPVHAGDLAGLVFADADSDGEMGSDEVGLADVAVALTDAMGGEWYAATDENGEFLITDVPVGDATVTVAAPAGHAVTTSNDVQTLLVTEGATVLADPVGYEPVPVATGGVAGFVFADGDADGVLDVGELGLGGVEVSMTDALSGEWSVATNGNGEFTFTDVPVGDAALAVIAPPGHVLTTMNGTQMVTVAEATTTSVDHVGVAAFELLLPGVYAVDDVHFLFDARSLNMGDGDAVESWPDEVAGIELVAVASLDAPTYSAGAGFDGVPSVEFDGIDDTLEAAFGELNTNDVVFHFVLETIAYGHRTVVMSRHSTGTAESKHVLGYDDYDEDRTLSNEPAWVVMSGPNGTQAEHYHPILSTTAGHARNSPTDDVAADAHRVVVTYVVRETGQIRFWDRLDDLLDETMAAAGNNLDAGIRLGSREDANPSSFGNFRLAFLMAVDETGYSEADLLDAASELGAWFNVPGFDTP